MTRKINDPVFGLIELNDIESQIIDTPLFQRLRYIKQLALANYVYPTAIHNRFSHSLGVFYLTNKIATNLNGYKKDLMDKSNIQNLKMAALLHDIGHFPFSHTGEFESKQDDFQIDKFPFFFKKSHEELGCYIIKNSYLHDILDENGYDSELILNLILGNEVENLILNRIINWELDADRIDYILRDSYFTGVGFGNLNYQYLLSNFKSYKDTRIVIDSKAIRDIEHFIISRFSLHDRVYTHKTSSYFNYMLTLATYNIIKDGKYPSFISKSELNDFLSNENQSEKLYELTDFHLSSTLQTRLADIKNSQKSRDLDLQKIIEAIFYRKKHYKINKYLLFSSKTESETEIMKFRIKQLIEDLTTKYPLDIFVHTPKNVFTNFMGRNLPNFRDKSVNYGKVHEEEEKTIWIQQKSQPPEIFYRSKESFFQKIFGFGITKFLIYIKKENKELKREFLKVEPKINELLRN